MIKLLGRQTSGNVQKVLFCLEEIGVPYTREDYGRQFGNTQSAEYKALNPTSKVPTLVDGDVVIWESNTILRYLAATKAEGLTGATPAERTEVERWMDFQLAAINPGYLAAFKESKLKPEDRSPGYPAAEKDLADQLALVDAHLAGKDFLARGKLTIADIALAPILKRCMDFPITRGPSDNIARWLKGIEARPAFQTATGAKPAASAA